MISVSEEISSLKEREQQLHTSLDNLRGQKSKIKEHRQLDKELAQLIRKRQNLESLARFEVGMPVHRADSRSLGKVAEIIITPGGLWEVWVSWDGKLQVPEQPHLLEPDAEAIAQIIAVGDRIIIGKNHAARGKTFTVARLLARGWVETTDDDVFPREYWTKLESPVASEAMVTTQTIEGITQQEEQVNVINPQIEMVEESPQEEPEELPEVVVTVEAVVTTTQEIGELSEDEEQERHRLELKVERAYYEAGSALKQLRDKRLYRSSHRTFEAYCLERFGYQRSRCYQMIDAAIIVDNLKKCPQFVDKLPKSESQCRPLSNLTPEQQRQTWGILLTETGGAVPTGKEVKGIVERMKEKPLTLASDFCSIGDVFILSRLEGTERKYNGCWAIAVELRDFTIAVDVYDAVLTVKPDNLQPIDSPDVRRQLPEILKRIRRLRECDLLDRCAYTVLESLGRQTYLTDFEADLLTFMEQRYGIEN